MKIRMMLAALAILPASAAMADDCAAYTKEDAFDLNEAEIVALYDCLQEKMATGYAAKEDEVGSVYRDWAVSGTRPAVAGVHSNRLLMTFANDIAADQYLQFADDNVVMPAGSILAKESITLSKKRQMARPGPLFIMTKLEAGGAPETGDWLYSGVQPNGNVMRVSQSFCHDCHVAYEHQDMLGYPVEEVRVGQ